MVAKHLIETNHYCNSNLEILRTEIKGKKLDALEILEIKKLKHLNTPLMNENLFHSPSPLLAIQFQE